jgi:outer membrane receptor protein involved in Fe transport
MPSRGVPRPFFLFLCLVLSIVPASLRAGTTGKLAGRIVDEKGSPLAGANVRIPDVRLGAVSDEQGAYFIIGVPAGIHGVQASLLGYAPFAVQEVEIRPDFTTALDIHLRTQAVQMSEVKVEAERPLLQKDATGTTRFLSAKDIQHLPARGYREAAALQSGVVNYQRQTQGADQATLIVRGGRANEVAYYVDGFSQLDAYTGLSSTSVSNNAIQEVVVLTGGFAPEYGRIMSGAVNVITEEGAKRFSGALEALTDNLAGSWVGARPTDYNLYDFSLGGPLLAHSDRLTFYASTERRWERDRLPTFMPQALRDQLSSGTSYAPSGEPPFAGSKLDPDVKPGNGLSGFTAQGKTTWRPSDAITVRLGNLSVHDDWREYVHAFLFNPDHMPRHLDETQSSTLTMNHVLSPRSFYSLGVNYYQSLSKTGDPLAFADLTESARLWTPTRQSLNLDFPIFGLPTATGGSYGVVPGDFVQHMSSYVGLQAQITSQVTPHHQLKFGGEFERHTLRSIYVADPVGLGAPSPNLQNINGFGYGLVLHGDSTVRRTVDLVDLNDGHNGAKHPKILSLYAQDKFEREGVIVNGGLRFDYLNVDTPALVNDLIPLGDPNVPGSLPDSLDSGDLVKNSTYARISPRLGIAFPVDERTLLRFNYGQFYQQPSLRDLYVNYDYLQYLIRARPYYLDLGNPNLRPERTTAYEVGMAHQFADNVRLDVTTYYKDVKDLTEVSGVPGTQIAFYRNRDFATIKGVDLGLTVRPTRHTGANLSYSLSSAVGTGSASGSQFRTVWLGGPLPKQTAPLDFDQRHKLSANLDFRLGENEGPAWGSFRPLQNFGVDLLYNVASGTPYTPTQIYNEVGLIVASAQPAAPVNSRYGPWTATLDLKADREFHAGGMRLSGYVWVLNLLDARNPIAVYHSSGSATTTGWLDTADGQAYIDNAANHGVDGQKLYQLAENNPLLYSNPRLVRFGVKASF